MYQYNIYIQLELGFTDYSYIKHFKGDYLSITLKDRHKKTHLFQFIRGKQTQ